MRDIWQAPYETVEGRELLHTEDSELRVTVSNTLADDDRERIWDMVQQGFVSLNSRSGSKQDMTREEFDHDLKSLKDNKYVAYNAQDEPVGFLNVHLDLEDITWAPDSVKEKMHQLQHELNSNAEPAYVGTLVVPEQLRGRDIAAALIRASYIHWQENVKEQGDILCFFDCADANNPGIPMLLKWLSRPGDNFPGMPLSITEIAAVQEGGKEATVLADQNPSIANTQHYFVMKRLEQ